MTRLIRVLRIVGALLGLFTLLVIAAYSVNFFNDTATTETLATNFTLVNLGPTTATVAVSYYKPDGSNWPADAGNSGFTIGPNGGQRIVRQYLDGTLTAGSGSAIVSSDQPLGAVAQILANYPGAPAQNASNGAYVGMSAPADTWVLPQVAKNGSSSSGTVNSQIWIQNAGSSAVTVQVVFSNGYTKSGINVNPGASFNYDLSLDGSLANGFFSAVVSTNPLGGQIAVVANTFVGADGLQTLNGFAASSASNAWAVPIFYAQLLNGVSSALVVQNVSGGSLAIGQITVSCVHDPASANTTNFTLSNTGAVANNASVAFNANSGWTGPTNWFGACRVTTSPSANVVAYVLTRFFGTSNMDSVPAINANGTNKHVFVPLVAKHLSNGSATVVTIVNLSNSSSANVTLTYTAGAGSPGPATASTSTSIPAGGSLIQNHRLSSFTVGATAMPDGWFGTLTVSSSTTAIDATVSLSNYLNPPGDTFMMHNAFTTP